jgi:hypothetical protein
MDLKVINNDNEKLSIFNGFGSLLITKSNSINLYEDKNIFSDNLLKDNINSDNLLKKKKSLIEISKNLTKIEYLEIFNIIQNNNCQYTRNSNGVFINLQNVSEEIIDKIFNFLSFIKHKKEDLLKQEEYLFNYKKNIIEPSIEKNQDNNFNEENKIYELSDSEDDNNNSNYLLFSSDDDENLENKISLKKKKVKYTGKKLKIIKSIKDNNDNNKIKK